MKNLIAALIALPLLTSCEIVQQEYYDSGYYNPPPQVEVVRPYRYYQDGRIHRPRPRMYPRGYHRQPGPAPVVINPSPRHAPNVQQVRPVQPRPAVIPVPRGGVVTPRPQVQVQPNVHTPAPRVNLVRPMPPRANPVPAPRVTSTTTPSLPEKQKNVPPVRASNASVPGTAPNGVHAPRPVN